MSVAHKIAVAEMAKFKPKEPRVEIRVQVVKSLAEDLDLIARVRTEVNKQVGDGTVISPTAMLLEEATELREQQFAEWGGRPDSKEAEAKLVAKLVGVFSAEADAVEKTKKR